MRLWTIQPRAVWEQVQRDGVAWVDERRIGEDGPYGGCADFAGYVPDAYRWLTNFLRQQRPGWEGRLPWWCYTKKPDLRWHRHSGCAGPYVRIELEVPRDECVAFPCWAWGT